MVQNLFLKIKMAKLELIQRNRIFSPGYLWELIAAEMHEKNTIIIEATWPCLFDLVLYLNMTFNQVEPYGHTCLPSEDIGWILRPMGSRNGFHHSTAFRSHLKAISHILPKVCQSILT